MIDREAALQRMIAAGFTDTIIERFLSKFEQTEGCWIWKGANNCVGYGKISKNGSVEKEYAHRVSWLIFRGEIPKGLYVLHNCPGGDNPNCVNPTHLFLGTQKQNQEDMARKGRAHKGFKLTQADVDEIRRLRPATPIKEVAARFGISITAVSQVFHGQRWNR